MRGNAPPVRLQASDWTWIYVGGGVFVVVAGALTYVVLRRRRRNHVRTLVGGLAPRAQRLDMTSERALERLLAIEQSGVLARDDDRKTGYADMVSVIRDYLAARYRFPTAELTTSELMRGLAKRASAADAMLVEAWLARCDLVKYGGVRATQGQALETLAGAREVVMQTTVVPAVAKEAA
jgi:hypothetical protein